jgi:hypothetical protein
MLIVGIIIQVVVLCNKLIESFRCQVKNFTSITY